MLKGSTGAERIVVERSGAVGSAVVGSCDSEDERVSEEGEVWVTEGVGVEPGVAEDGPVDGATVGRRDDVRIVDDDCVRDGNWVVELVVVEAADEGA